MVFKGGLFSEVPDLQIDRASSTCKSNNISQILEFDTVLTNGEAGESIRDEISDSRFQIPRSDQISCPSSDTAPTYPWSTPNTAEASLTSLSSFDYQVPDDK